MQYIAFLRGINVGRHARIKMADLKDAFLDMGFDNVRTVLATGNIIFESDIRDEAKLTQELESQLKNVFEKKINVMLRRIDELKKLQLKNPFSNIKTSKSTQLYVTFLPERINPNSITIPYISPQEELNIISIISREVFSVVDISKGKGTTSAMNIMEKEFGPNITTRNWNTVLKILK